MLTNEKDISVEVVSFFSSVLSKDPSLSLIEQDDILNCIPQSILPHHKKSISAIPKAEEVREDLFSLPVDKSLGPDGFPTFFFQTYW